MISIIQTFILAYSFQILELYPILPLKQSDFGGGRAWQAKRPGPQRWTENFIFAIV